jgi:putative MFS transporter
MRGRTFDLITLATGLSFVGAGVTMAIRAWPLFAHLPGDPRLYAELFEVATGTIDPFMTPLGAVVTLLTLFDAARYSTLRTPRVRWRLLAMVCVCGLALAGGLWIDPLRDEAIAGANVKGQLQLAVALQQALFVLTALALIAGHRTPGPPRIDRGERYAARWLPPVFGGTPKLPERQWRFLGLMIAATFFNAYDMQVFGLALKQIQAGLGIDEGHLGFLGSAIALGVVPGVLLAVCADTWGRRRVLLVTIVGYTLFTGLTAFSQDETTFLGFQFMARAFGAAEMVLASVVVAEEIDAEHRGWALGVLGALGMFGAGLALLIFGFVETLPLGWRSMYLVGFFPLAVIAYLRRRLPETSRFESQAARAEASPTLASALRPLVSLVKVYPRRFAAISSVRFLNAFATQAPGLFLPKYLQEEHGWDPGRFAIVGAVIGFGALCAMPLVGRLGDRMGRKPVSIVFMAVIPLSVVGLYGTSGALLVPAFWFALSFSDGGADLNVSTFGKELFPTSYRSTADSSRQLVGQLGGSLGLAMESVLYAFTNSHAIAISIVALPAVLMPFIVAFAIPETSGRDLEEIAPEPPPATRVASLGGVDRDPRG